MDFCLHFNYVILLLSHFTRRGPLSSFHAGETFGRWWWLWYPSVKEKGVRRKVIQGLSLLMVVMREFPSPKTLSSKTISWNIDKLATAHMSSSNGHIKALSSDFFVCFFLIYSPRLSIVSLGAAVITCTHSSPSESAFVSLLKTMSRKAFTDNCFPYSGRFRR